jgi:hypothetical protein
MKIITKLLQLHEKENLFNEKENLFNEKENLFNEKENLFMIAAKSS